MAPPFANLFFLVNRYIIIFANMIVIDTNIKINNALSIPYLYPNAIKGNRNTAIPIIRYL